MSITNRGETVDIGALTAFVQKNRLAVHDYGKREIIASEAELNGKLGIILKGSAYIAGINENGKRGIIEFFFSGDVISQSVFPPFSDSSYFYLASAVNCTAALADYDMLIKPTGESETAEKLLKYAVLHSSSTIFAHTYIIEQRTLEEKLMLFFEYISLRSGSDTFILPMSYTNLADYLAADRSAMMREIGRLISEGKITADKLKIHIINK